MYVLDCAYVKASRRLNRYQKRTASVDFSRDNGFLLIAAGHTSYYGNGTLSGSYVIFLNEFFRIFSDLLETDKTFIGKFLLPIPFENEILLERIVQNKSVFVPVFGNMTHSGLSAHPDARIGNILSAKLCLSSVNTLEPRESVNQVRLTVSFDTGDADYFSRTNVERYAVNGILLGNSVHHS